MELKDIQEFITNNKDNKDLQAYLQGLNPMTVEGVQKFVSDNADAKKWLDSEKDKHLNKGLETWKTNNMQKLIDDAVAKANPKETPEQKQIRELTARIEKAEKEKSHESLQNKALQIAQQKKLPTNLVNYFIGDDEETTTKNLEALEKEFNAQVNTVAESRLASGYKPPKNTNTNLTAEQQAQEQINNIFGLK